MNVIQIGKLLYDRGFIPSLEKPNHKIRQDISSWLNQEGHQDLLNALSMKNDCQWGKIIDYLRDCLHNKQSNKP